MPFRSEWQESLKAFGSETPRSLSQARIQELENLVKKEQQDRASAEPNDNALKLLNELSLRTQIQTIRFFFTPDEAYCSKILVFDVFFLGFFYFASAFVISLPGTGACLMPFTTRTHTAATTHTQTAASLMPCLTRAHKQAAGAKLPEDLKESIGSVEPHLLLSGAQSAEHSEALGQTGTASAKRNFAGIIAVMNAYPHVARIQVCVCVYVCVCVCVCVCVWRMQVLAVLRWAHAHALSSRVSSCMRPLSLSLSLSLSWL